LLLPVIDLEEVFGVPPVGLRLFVRVITVRTLMQVAALPVFLGQAFERAA
jgi:hypothetical protein